MKKQTLHVIGLPHTRTNKDYNACAYTAKLYKFLQMFPDAIHYANEGSECDNLVPIFSNSELLKYFGQEEWYTMKQWYRVSYDTSNKYWQQFNAQCIVELADRIQPQDLILTLAGTSQKIIADAFPDNQTVEFGIGYEGVFSNYRVYESFAWMHYLYGKQNIENGRFYDTVIPNYFDINDFHLASSKEDYLLFMGRPTERKGLSVLHSLAEHHKIITAGSEPVIGLDWAGYADTEKRAQLMSKAKAVLVPTLYIGPFEGVNVEAQLCGTPVLTTNFGAFAETVEHGITGFRCNTMQEFHNAVEKCEDLDPHIIRDRAVSLYGLDAIKPQYEEYFARLATLYGEGWTEINKSNSLKNKSHALQVS